eukprot:2860183-Amphidinium_carterae.1
MPQESLSGSLIIESAACRFGPPSTTSLGPPHWSPTSDATWNIRTPLTRKLQGRMPASNKSGGSRKYKSLQTTGLLTNSKTLHLP